MDYYIAGDKVSSRNSFQIFPQELYCDCEESKGKYRTVSIVVYDGLYIYSGSLEQAKQVAHNPSDILHVLNSKRRDLQTHTSNALNRLSYAIVSYEQFLNETPDETLKADYKKYDYFPDQRKLKEKYLPTKHKEIMDLYRHLYFDLWYAGYDYETLGKEMPVNLLSMGIFGD